MINPPPTPHDGRQHPHRQPDQQRWDHRHVLARGTKPHLERQCVDPGAGTSRALDGRLRAARLAQGIQAFEEHQRADDPEEHDVTKLHQQIDLPQTLEVVEHENAQPRSGQPADQQHRPHGKVDRPAPEMRQHGREGGRDDLVGAGGHGHRGGHADEEQKRRDQKPAADPEHARQHPDQPAQTQKHVCIHGNFGDWQVDVHDP